MKWFLAVGLLLGCAKLSVGNSLRRTNNGGSHITTTSESDSLKGSSQTASERWSEVECLAGSEWVGNCHSCSCSDRGRAICTKLENCKESHEEPLRCKPQSIFKRDCNTCRCLDNGLGLCTMRGCPKASPAAVTEKAELPSGMLCAVGSRWTSRCNECVCSADGEPECSKEDCPGKENEPESQCAEGSVWKNDCNTCWCSRGRADCTKIGCSQHVVLDWNPTITEGANKLTTTTTPIPINIEDIGMRFKRSSTQQNTNLAETTSRPTPNLKKACQPGQEFRMDCNKCLCDNEGQNFSCTRIDCAAINNGNGGDRAKREVTSQNQTDCAPGSVFEQGCNVCRCTSDGNHATCTMKSCQENPDNDINVPESDPSFRCNPGEQFKRGCKDCTCSADGRSVFCTLRLCDQDINPSL